MNANSQYDTWNTRMQYWGRCGVSRAHFRWHGPVRGIVLSDCTLNRCPGSAASTRHLQFFSTYHLFNVRTGNVVMNVSKRCAVEYNYNFFCKYYKWRSVTMTCHRIITLKCRVKQVDHKIPYSRNTLIALNDLIVRLKHTLKRHLTHKSLHDCEYNGPRSIKK